MDHLEKEFEKEQKEKIDRESEPQGQALPKKKKNFLWLWILIIVIVLGGGASAYAFRDKLPGFFGKKQTNSNSANSNSANSNTNIANKNANTNSSVKIVDSGITWLNPRVKLGDLGLFQGNPSGDANFPDAYKGTTYYKVATTDDGGEIILALAKVETLGVVYDFHHFIKKAGKYFWMSEHSDNVGSNDNLYSLVSSDKDATIIKSLQLDQSFTQKNIKFTSDFYGSRNYQFVESEPQSTKVDETKWGDLYILKGDDVDKSNGEVKVTQYYILRNDGMKIIYSPSPTFKLDDNTLDVTWSNSAGASQKFSQVKTSGCGFGSGSFPMVVKNTSLNNKAEVAMAKDGTKLYSVPGTSTLADFVYQVYQMDLAENKESRDTFNQNLPVIVYKDAYDSWIVFMNDKYQPLAECGKPVIYLYPEKEIEVSVKVGANITKSEPEYGKGWKVLAAPSGTLKVDGKKYDSLFWEGIGFGKYPSITSGKIVESKKAVDQIKSDLTEMGLNAKEIADFLDFWADKMPTTKYTRLTWLLTEEMNTLAPLAVSPKPDSSIRVFLDYEGLNDKVNIASQTLPHYERNGFTLVEWGGILRGKQ